MKSFSRWTDERRWILQCVALVFPLAAALHHVVFYRPTCMLHRFGPEYNLEVLHHWVTRDPSLGWAIAIALLTFVGGTRSRFGPLLRQAVPPFVIAFLPLAVWIWDIPFTGRAICSWGHDSRAVLPVIGALRTRHFYAFGAITFAALFVAELRARRTKSAPISAQTPALGQRCQEPSTVHTRNLSQPESPSQ